MKVQVIAREIPGKTDEDLQCLDAIVQGPVHDIYDPLSEHVKKLDDEFLNLHPECRCWDASIEVVEEKKKSAL